MTNDITCKHCDHIKEAPDLICQKRAGSDGLPLRCVGKWSKNKFYYLERYITAFTVSMRNKWKLNYIDLFSGPGRCFNRDEQIEIESSPIIALKSRYKFNKCFFVDLRKENIECLERSGYKSLSDRNDNSVTRFFLNRYRRQLEKIGYVETQLGEERLIKSSKKNLPLYFLVFASKNKLGHKFWRQIGDIEPSGQRSLKF